MDDEHPQDRRKNPLTAWIPPGRRVVTSFDVPLFGGEVPTLRVGLMLDSAGWPSELVMAVGTGDNKTWREAPELGGLTLPANCLPTLVNSLYHLDKIRMVLSDIEGKP